MSGHQLGRIPTIFNAWFYHWFARESRNGDEMLKP